MFLEPADLVGCSIALRQFMGRDAVLDLLGDPVGISCQSTKVRVLRFGGVIFLIVCIMLPNRVIYRVDALGLQVDLRASCGLLWLRRTLADIFHFRFGLKRARDC